MSRQTIWIAGGVDKGNDYKELVPIAKEKVKALVCLGKDNDQLISSFKDSIDLIAETDSMQAAVHAFSIAKKGEDRSAFPRLCELRPVRKLRGPGPTIRQLRSSTVSKGRLRWEGDRSFGSSACHWR